MQQLNRPKLTIILKALQCKMNMLSWITLNSMQHCFTSQMDLPVSFGSESIKWDIGFDLTNYLEKDGQNI